MANTQAPFGFRQFRRLDGGAPTAGFDTLTIASSDPNLYFTGDPVATSATGPYITVPSTGVTMVRGIFMGCEYYSPSVARKVWSPYFPGSVMTSSGTNDVQAWVCTDPDMLYTVQTSTAGQVAVTDIGQNAGFTTAVSSLGNTLTGQSVVTLGSTSLTTSSSAPFRIWDMWSNWAPPGQNGTDNASVGNIVIVQPNNFDRKNLTGV